MDQRPPPRALPRRPIWPSGGEPPARAAASRSCCRAGLSCASTPRWTATRSAACWWLWDGDDHARLGLRSYLACGVTDMRKGMTGLAVLVQQSLAYDPFRGAVYAIRGRRAGLIKLLWHGGVG